jgi:hypothetical protein
LRFVEPKKWPPALIVIDLISCLGVKDSLNSPDEDEGEMPNANHMGRRRSRAVLYQLSGHYKHQDKIKPKIKISSVSIAFRIKVSLFC